MTKKKLSTRMAGSLALAAAMMSGTATVARAQLVEAAATAQVKDDFFAGTEMFAKGASDVTEVNMDAKALGLLAGKGGEKAALAQKMDFIVIHTYSYDKPGAYRMEDFETFRRKLTDGSWSCIVHERSKEESTDICMRQGGDHESNEMVILTAEKEELTFIHMKGRVSLNDLQKLGNLGGAAAPAAPVPPPKERKK